MALASDTTHASHADNAHYGRRQCSAQASPGSTQRHHQHRRVTSQPCDESRASCINNAYLEIKAQMVRIFINTIILCL